VEVGVGRERGGGVEVRCREEERRRREVCRGTLSINEEEKESDGYDGCRSGPSRSLQSGSLITTDGKERPLQGSGVEPVLAEELPGPGRSKHYCKFRRKKRETTRRNWIGHAPLMASRSRGLMSGARRGQWD
jgi:hypothetical protein